MESESKQESIQYGIMEGVVQTPENARYFEAMESIQKELSGLNVNRGGRNNPGFMFEPMHASESNIRNRLSGNGDVVTVLGDNGPADLKVTHADGSVTYQQAKMGYHGSGKYGIDYDKYEGQPLVVDKGNFELGRYSGEKKGKEVEYSTVSKESADSFSELRKGEAQITGNKNAPVTSQLYIAGKQLEMANASGIAGAKKAAAFAAGVSFGKNMYELIEGNAELKEVLVSTGKDTVIAAASGYVSGAVGYVAMGAAQTAVSVVSQVTGIVVVADTAALTAVMGPVVAIVPVAAGPLFLMGMAVGTGSAVCKAVKTKNRAYRQSSRKVNRQLNQALRSMKMAYDDLDQSIKETYAFWDKSFEQGFRDLLAGVEENDFTRFSAGLDTVMGVFGSNVLFHTMDEFDAFFYDDDAVLTL